MCKWTDAVQTPHRSRINCCVRIPSLTPLPTPCPPSLLPGLLKSTPPGPLASTFTVPPPASLSPRTARRTLFTPNTYHLTPESGHMPPLPRTFPWLQPRPEAKPTSSPQPSTATRALDPASTLVAGHASLSSPAPLAALLGCKRAWHRSPSQTPALEVPLCLYLLSASSEHTIFKRHPAFFHALTNLVGSAQGSSDVILYIYCPA